MEAEGITRACTIVPVIRKNASATQTQESSSRTKRWRKVLDSAADDWLGALGGANWEPAERSVSASVLLGPVVVKSSFTGLSFGFRNCDLFATTSGHANFELHVFAHVGAGVTGSAEAAGSVAHGAAQAFEREIADRISIKEEADLFERASSAGKIEAASFGQPRPDARSIRGEQFLARGRIDTVIAGRNRRRATDAHMNLRGACFAHHAHDLAAGGTANDGVVNQDDALTFEQRAHGIELQFDTEIADGLLGLDERAADIVISNQAHAKGQARFERVAD